MTYTLVIVESPNKTRKIEGFLGAGYRCVASFGHFRDLPESGDLGIDFSNGDVVPNYQIMEKGKRAIATISKLVKGASKIVLATDPDREGEAISWHLREALRIPRGVSCVRATFHEITQSAVQKAIASPRAIDINMVNAQQSRRMLDRCVGWIVSDTMRQTVRDAKSAGRVQSVAVRLVVEREREISAFTAATYFVVDATLERDPRKPRFVARMVSYEGKVIGQTWLARSVADRATERCRDAAWQVASVDRREVDKAPPPPFTTSTVQQATSVALKITPKQCMDALQRLFEAGHITYHRTDSPSLSDEAMQGARTWIAQNLPKGYLPTKPRFYQANGNAQEAHEAIRPTHWETGPDAVAGDDSSLYRMIWTRFLASQCADGRDSRTTIGIDAITKANGDAFGLFQVKGVFPIFDGWRKIASLAEEERPDIDEKPDILDEDVILPVMASEDWLSLIGVTTKTCTTKPPPRYTQSKLIAMLEKQGIGRPSTYAAIMETIISRGYVEQKKLKLFATELGMRSIDYLVANFSGDFIDVGFTRQVEADLDRIAAGSLDWCSFTTRCARSLAERAQAAGYVGDPLASRAARAEKDGGPPCPRCGKGTFRRTSPHGAFFGCSAFPKCKGVINIAADDSCGTTSSSSPQPRIAPAPSSPSRLGPAAAMPASPTCPDCSKPMTLRKSSRGPFWGCTGYPTCRGTRPST